METTTESANAVHDGLDCYDVETLVGVFVDDQRDAIEAVRAARTDIARAVAAATPRITAGGRLVYVGAGTSGRLGMLDAVELYPTFAWPAERAVVLLAGGDVAITRAVEGAEDDDAQGAADVENARVGENDVVLGIAASGRTPYVIGALAQARKAGALTIGIANNPGSQVPALADIGITLATGAEVITGSTRLKAGTSQKIALNTFSSALMVALNKVYRNLMVDMVPTNAKLRRRAVSMTALAAGVDEARALAALEASQFQIKTAIVGLKCGVDAGQASALLAAVDGNVRRAITGR